MLIRLVLKLFNSHYFTAIIVKCTNYVFIIFIFKFLPSYLLVHLLPGIGQSTALYIQEIRFSQGDWSLLKDKIEISCQWQRFQNLLAPVSSLSRSPRCWRFLHLPDCQLQNQLCSFLRQVEITALSYSCLWYQLLTRQKYSCLGFRTVCCFSATVHTSLRYLFQDVLMTDLSRMQCSGLYVLRFIQIVKGAQELQTLISAQINISLRSVESCKHISNDYINI